MAWKAEYIFVVFFFKNNRLKKKLISLISDCCLKLRRKFLQWKLNRSVNWTSFIKKNSNFKFEVQLGKLVSKSIHWQCLLMNMSVIGRTVTASLHADDDANDDERDSDDTHWDTRLPSWSCVIWLASLFWWAARMSMSVRHPIDSSRDSGWGKSCPSLTSPAAYDCECVVAQTMISSDEKYPCVNPTTSSPCLSCAEKSKGLSCVRSAVNS